MAWDYISIGPAPCNEDCAQVGTPGYAERAFRECQRFRDLIRKKLGPEPEGARLVIKRFPHDFGDYYEVVCEFEIGNEEALGYAIRCESEAPTEWED